MEGMPDTLTAWTRLARKYHARWAMSRAFRYAGKQKGGKDKPRWNPQSSNKEKRRDPDAMDVDFTQLGLEERERLMKTGSCFKCRQRGHISKECPTWNRASIHEASTSEKATTSKGKDTTEDTTLPKRKEKDSDPPSYESIRKQINACSLKERTKLLELFSDDGDSGPEDF